MPDNNKISNNNLIKEKKEMNITNRLRIMLKSLLSFQMGEVKTDKAILVFDGEELKEGMEVYVIGEDGEPVAAADGDYTVEDGKVIKVVEGKVAEIVDPEAEVAEEPIEETAEKEIAQEEVEQEANEEVEPVEEPEAEEAVETVEDRVARVEERLAEFTEGLNQIINSIAALEERIAAVEGKLAKVEEPAANPVDETPDVEQTTHKSPMSYLRKD